MEKRILTFEEACAYTGFAQSYMYKLTSGRKIPHSKPNGKRIFFDKEKLDGWLLGNPIKTKDQLEKEKPIVEKEETIDEFIYNKDISVALSNVLKHGYRSGTRLVSEIKKNEFMEIRGAGEKRWAEFIKARGF